MSTDGDTARVPTDSRERRLIQWAPIALEAFFVVLGVVLALAANEWREHRGAERRALVALEAIEGEVRENRAAVARALAYHLALHDSLRAFERHHTPGTPAPPRLFDRGFVAPASVFSTAWTSAQTTDVAGHFSYDAVISLSRLYEEQERYEAQGREIGGLIYAALFGEGFEAMLNKHANIGTIAGTLWYQECRLLRRYDETLDALGASSPTPPRPDACAYVEAP